MPAPACADKRHGERTGCGSVIGSRNRNSRGARPCLAIANFARKRADSAHAVAAEVGICFADPADSHSHSRTAIVFGFKKLKPVVGLDIGSSAVKAVELKAAGKGFKVAAFAVQPVPPDSIVDGAIIDGAAVADAIKRLFESKAFKTKEVAASLSGNAVIVKKINLPVMTEAELSESIYWEAEQYIPFDIQDVNLDYQILNPGTSGEAQGTMEVLLVAAKKEKIADYTGVISQAGRTPVIVDVDAFALQNAYETNYGLEAESVVVLLNAGASAININILTGDQSVFTRDISIGGNA